VRDAIEQLPKSFAVGDALSGLFRGKSSYDPFYT